MRLKPYQTFLSLEFSTLGFTRSKDLNYQIRMVGKSLSWDQMKNNRTVTFTHLSKGWHQLEVRSVSEGLIYGPSTILNIYRQPTFWQTAYAYALYFIVLIFIFLFARREFFMRQEEKNTLALERYEKENQKTLNDQKMRFFLNISHEFRTPLTIIGGTISNIFNKFYLEKEVAKKLQTIQNTSENLNKLVNDFLDYGKLDSGFKPLELMKEPIMPFLEKTCDMFDSWADINQLVYKKNIPNSNIQGYFDPVKLERVLYNLISNAFKFNKSHGTVIVEVEIRKDSQNWLHFSVEDNGPGISDELCEDLRDYFENAKENGINDKSIGLAYTAGIVQQMGGNLSLESKLGVGTSFSVNIPLDLAINDPIIFENDLKKEQLSQVESVTNKAYSSLIKEEKKPSLLIIDDNTELLNMLKDSLELNYNIMISNSPKQALPLAINKEITLIICDIMMPEMNGFEVIESLQSNILTSHIPILILTAAVEKDIEFKSYKKGAVSYLAKPFKVEELVLKIDSILSFRSELIRRFQGEHNISVNEVTRSEKDEQFLQKATNIVQENIDNINFDVDEFCSKLIISRTLLHMKLKNITGMSTTEFIRCIRLRQAYVYLKKDSFTVSEVAYKCGFNDPNYFSKCFKKAFNIFPSKL
ncbi:Sensor histidine kinase RcsC [subsurface metagenome]